MGWNDNKWRGASTNRYEITAKQYETLFSFACMPDISIKEKNALVLEFWTALGKKMDFDPLSISCLNSRGFTFEAAPA